MRLTLRGLACGLLAGLLAGCAAPSFPLCAPATPDAETDSVYLVSEGWHTELGIPQSGLLGPLAVFRQVFPGVRTLMIGFGKRTFITAKVESLSELMLGPVPGPGAMEVTGLNTPPDQAYPRDTVTRLRLPPGGAAGLARFVWRSLGKTETDRPRPIAPGLFPGSLFYAATDGYALTNTCNNWTADALRAAGLPMAPGPDITAGQTMRAASATGQACRIAPEAKNPAAP